MEDSSPAERMIRILVVLSLSRRSQGFTVAELAEIVGRSRKQTRRYCRALNRFVAIEEQVRDGVTYYSLDRDMTPEWIHRLGVTKRVAA